MTNQSPQYVSSALWLVTLMYVYAMYAPFRFSDSKFIPTLSGVPVEFGNAVGGFCADFLPVLLKGKEVNV